MKPSPTTPCQAGAFFAKAAGRFTPNILSFFNLLDQWGGKKEKGDKAVLTSLLSVLHDFALSEPDMTEADSLVGTFVGPLETRTHPRVSLP